MSEPSHELSTEKHFDSHTLTTEIIQGLRDSGSGLGRIGRWLILTSHDRTGDTCSELSMGSSISSCARSPASLRKRTSPQRAVCTEDRKLFKDTGSEISRPLTSHVPGASLQESFKEKCHKTKSWRATMKILSPVVKGGRGPRLHKTSLRASLRLSGVQDLWAEPSPLARG